MKSYQKIVRVYCGHEGCHETTFYSYDNKKEADRIYQKYGNGKWRCTRHSNPEEVLSLTNLKVQKILVAKHSEKYPELKTLFWNHGSGFTYGDDYKAYADDFPEGTKLIITAEIILPK